MKEYLGDSVYADSNGWQIVLTTENGKGEPSNTIYLESGVLKRLMEYADQFGPDKGRELKRQDAEAM